MNYEDLRKNAGTGDILLQAGTGLASRMIRVFTGSQYSHVALLVWIDNGLFVSEVKPGTGYTLTPASQRIEEMCNSGIVRYGKAPLDLNMRLAREAIMKFRDGAEDRDLDPSYSYLSGFIIWISQLINRPLPHKFVCSTYVQHIWAAGGIEFNRTADPEDFARYIENLWRVSI